MTYHNSLATEIARELDPKSFRETPVDPNDPNDESGLRAESEVSRKGRIQHVVSTIEAVLARRKVVEAVVPAPKPASVVKPGTPPAAKAETGKDGGR